MKPGITSGLVLLVPALALGQSSSDDTATPERDATPLEINIPLALPAEHSPHQVQRTPLNEAQGALEEQATTSSYTVGQRNFSQRISFSEFPQETVVTNQYRDRGIIFGGSGATITDDAAVSSAPVLAGTPLFEGDITGQFVIPGTDQPAPVYQFSWNIGHFDKLQTVQMDFYGPQGQLIHSIKNDGLGSYHYSVRGGNIGIASWRMHRIGEEPGGFGIDNLFFSIPGKHDLGREMGITECALGNPVNPAAGNKVQVETDYLGSRPFPLQVSRAYNSLSGQWTFFPSVDHSVGSIEAQITRPDGKIITYTGGHTLPDWRNTSTDVVDELHSERDGAGNIIGWRFETLDDVVEHYDSNGKLLSVRERSGLTHRYHYALDEIRVEHSLGGDIRYQLDTVGRITGFIDPLGQDYGFSYNSNNLLSSVKYPGDSGERHYHYENVTYPELLTGISDATGARFATWVYDNRRRAVRSEHHNGVNRTDFDYSQLDGPGTSNTTVTNPLGKDTTYYYTRINGVQRVFYVQGQPSDNCVAANREYQFDSRAFIRSKTDWRGNITEYLRDAKGRELIRREALGKPEEREIRTSWHPTFNLPSAIIEPGRETHYQYDLNGNLIHQQVIETNAP